MILEVLGVAAKDALVKDLTCLIQQLERVHARAFEAVESPLAVATLDSGALGFAAEAHELLCVDQVLQCLADVDPLFALKAKP